MFHTVVRVSPVAAAAAVAAVQAVITETGIFSWMFAKSIFQTFFLFYEATAAMKNKIWGKIFALQLNRISSSRWGKNFSNYQSPQLTDETKNDQRLVISIKRLL